MAIEYSRDSFSDVAGTTLASHTGEVEATWTLATDTGYTAASKISASGTMLTPNAQGASRYVASGTGWWKNAQARVVCYVGGSGMGTDTVVAGVNLIANTDSVGGLQKLFWGLVYTGSHTYQRLLKYFSDGSAIVQPISVMDDALGVSGVSCTIDLVYAAQRWHCLTNRVLIGVVDDVKPFLGRMSAGVQLGNFQRIPTEAQSILIDSFSANTVRTLPRSATTTVTLTRDALLTAWTAGTPGTPAFTLGGLGGCSISSQSISDANTASATIVTTNVRGALQVLDAAGKIVEIFNIGDSALSIDIPSGQTSTTPTIHLYGDGTAWNGLTASTLFSVTGGTGASIGSVTIIDDQHCSATLTCGTATGNLTITDTSTGATCVFAVCASNTSYAIGDANLYLSPYNWYVSGTAHAITASPGAYFKFAFRAVTSATVTLNLDTTPLSGASIPAGSWPVLRVVLNNKAYTDYTISASTLTLTTLCNVGDNLIEVFVLRVATAYDRWTNPSSAVKITSVTLPAGSYQIPLYKWAAQRPKNMVIFGDSITEGCAALNSDTGYAGNSGYAAYPRMVAKMLDAEYGQIGWSATAILTGGSSNVPKFLDTTTLSNSTYRNHSSGKARTISVSPDYVLIYHGTNDYYYNESTTTLTTALQTMISDMRSYFGANTKIFFVMPSALQHQNDRAYANAFSDAISLAGDAKVYYVDPNNTQFAYGLSATTTLLGSTRIAYDNLHPNADGHAEIAAWVAAYIYTNIASGGSSGGGLLTHPGMSGGMRG